MHVSSDKTHMFAVGDVATCNAFLRNRVIICNICMCYNDNTYTYTVVWFALIASYFSQVKNMKCH